MRRPPHRRLFRAMRAALHCATDRSSPAYLVLLTLAACKPEPVIAVDEWLDGYAAGDIERVVAHTCLEDRDLARAALAEQKTVATGTLATALPPRPLTHEIIEIESKDKERGRYVILAKTTLRNPLPYMSKRVANELQDMPMTRDQRRRFLVVREGDKWGVKLDLKRVLERDDFVVKFEKLMSAKKLDEAEAMLTHIPPPPDEANALHKSDRLLDMLKGEIKKARKAPDAVPAGKPD
jgi:hypothetical protein